MNETTSDYDKENDIFSINWGGEVKSERELNIKFKEEFAKLIC